jgi:hypothetical protein
MIDWSLQHDQTAQDRLAGIKFARGAAIVYGSVVLLLLATVLLGQRMRAEPGEATAVAAPPTILLDARQPIIAGDSDASTASIAPIESRRR